MPVLLPRRAFIRAVTEQVAWLAEHRPEEHLDHFLDALAIVQAQIERAPLRGSPQQQDERHVLRLRLFPRPLPYLVYYAHPRSDPIREIYLVGLYASGQDRPELDMSAWPW